MLVYLINQLINNPNPPIVKMDPPYWIVDDAIIFKPQFNSCLDDHKQIISNYKRLIFSDYNDPHVALETNNKYDDDEYANHNIHYASRFNQPLNNSLFDLDKLIELTFGENFNHPLGNSLSKLVNLRKLTFGSNFNQYLDDSLLDLPNLHELYFDWIFNQPLDKILFGLYNLQKLTFGQNFNQPLSYSLSNLVDLKELTFGYNFNQPLGDSLLDLINLQKLTFRWYFNQSLDNTLANLVNLRELTLGYYFNQPVDIPGWITKLVINCNSHNVIDYLPSNIIELDLGYDFNLELNDLPNSIKKIKIINPKYDKKLNNLPIGIESLELSKYYKVPIDFKYKNLKVMYF